MPELRTTHITIQKSMKGTPSTKGSTLLAKSMPTSIQINGSAARAGRPVSRRALLARRGPVQQPERGAQKHLHSILQGVLVYGEARVVVRVDDPLLLVASAHEEEGARRRLLQGREVLPAHVGAHDLERFVPEDRPPGLFYCAGNLLVVDHGPVAEPVLELVAR